MMEIVDSRSIPSARSDCTTTVKLLQQVLVDSAAAAADTDYRKTEERKLFWYRGRYKHSNCCPLNITVAENGEA
jgi:hypothetical protein